MKWFIAQLLSSLQRFLKQIMQRALKCPARLWFLFKHLQKKRKLFYFALIKTNLIFWLRCLFIVIKRSAIKHVQRTRSAGWKLFHDCEGNREKSGQLIFHIFMSEAKNPNISRTLSCIFLKKARFSYDSSHVKHVQRSRWVIYAMMSDFFFSLFLSLVPNELFAVIQWMESEWGTNKK